MPKFKDLTGNVYGDFTVIEMLRNYNGTKRTYCKCVDMDNNTYIIRQDALQSGATKHAKGACVAGKPCDITLHRFGRLVAKYPTDDRASNDSVMWMCECDCGNKKIVSAGNLRRHHTTSCGCVKRSNREAMIVDYLNLQNVIFTTEQTFDDLRNPSDTMNLYFDFYFPIQKVVIEYDGEHHFNALSFFGGEERLKYVKACDKIKDDYCEKNNIKMIRIPYTKTHEEVIQIIDKVIHP